jgi:hypothetical protein
VSTPSGEVKSFLPVVACRSASEERVPCAVRFVLAVLFVSACAHSAASDKPIDDPKDDAPLARAASR